MVFGLVGSRVSLSESRSPMTLQRYSPEKLDQFALRLLDLAAMMRQMASVSREHGIADLALHDKKAREWSAKLESWLQKAQADLDVRIRQNKARRRAISASPAPG
jgi:hypothetical protein